MIQTRNLSKNFGVLRAVEGLDLDIAQGEFFAFLGPNAAGKTTTIKMLTGLLKPSGGTATVAGFDIQEDPMAAKRLISYVPDFPFLYDKLTPREFLQFVGELYAMEKAQIAKQTGVLFEQFHLTEYHNELIENLSHGTRQRVAITAGLLHDPKVLIIDEPMVGLDPKHARIVKDEFKARSQAGCTIFLSTHTLVGRGGNGGPDRHHQPWASDRAGHGGGVAAAESRGRGSAGKDFPFPDRCRGQASRDGPRPQ